jgi:uncharacterized HAD superfamily protein/hypoxanthine phosphoribosyltransferase
MHFKSLSDLVRDIHEWIPSMVGRYDCVVGIPRSGMLVANILALKLGLPLADLDGFLGGRLLGLGKRYKHIDPVEYFCKPRRVLIVDDSISSGAALRIAKEKVEAAGLAHELTFMAVYVTPEGERLADLFVEVVPNPRRFEWNILSSRAIGDYCFDMDGVLCVDPTSEQNDDGPLYLDFIRNAKPLYLSSYKLGMIVTSRLEKYRSDTEEWLKRHGVSYGELRMLDLPSKEERIRLKAGAAFKANVYRHSSADLFIESDIRQAVSIAEQSRKFVYALDSVELVSPGGVSGVIERRKQASRKGIRRMLGRMKRKFLSLRR